MGAFQEKYPDIKISYTQAGAGECKTRIQAEADNPQGDVMFGGLVYADTLTYSDLFETYVCKNDDKMPDEFKNTTGVLTYHCLLYTSRRGSDVRARRSNETWKRHEARE